MDLYVQVESTSVNTTLTAKILSCPTHGSQDTSGFLNNKGPV